MLRSRRVIVHCATIHRNRANVLDVLVEHLVNQLFYVILLRS